MDRARCTKVGHSSEEAANNIIARAWSGKGFQCGALPIRAYLCYCKKWHTTSKPLRTRVEQIEAAKQKAGL